VSKPHDYRLTCSNCQHEWIGRPYDEQYAELCPECRSDEFQIGGEYAPSRIQAFWVVLLVPNFLIFWS
jgi:Zn finger protein HypA/HybF involved in hydrogenase expression